MFLIFVGFSSGQFHSYLFESRGIRGLQIGFIIMAGQGVGILSPLFQVSIIRRFRGPRPPLMLMLAGAGIALAALPHARGFWPLLICFCAFSFCGAGIFPLNAACTFESLRTRGHGAFFRLRSLGTLGFLVGCVVSVFFPTLDDLPLLYGGFALSLLGALAAVIWEYRTDPGPGGGGRMSAPGRGSSIPTFAAALRLLREPRTFRLLILLGVMNFANVMATGVQGNYLVDRWHEGQRTISMAWVVSTACEVPLMLLCAAVLRRSGLRYVIGLGILGTVLKLAGLALAGEVWQYYLALSLHGCFFSGALTGFSVYLDRTYKREERAALQALAPVFYAGIPSSLAGLAAGLLWHAVSLRAVYLASGGIAVAAAACALAWMRSGGPENGKNAF
ncbi:MAG TPA: MFS transporter [Fibrobacteria bacterium]|nr:MFS transporter [Fibrobacteria bacterium]